MPGLFEAYEGESLVLSQSKARGNRKRLLPTISQMMQDSNNVNSGLNEVLGGVGEHSAKELVEDITNFCDNVLEVHEASVLCTGMLENTQKIRLMPLTCTL
jgi:hypothetical protein